MSDAEKAAGKEEVYTQGHYDTLRKIVAAQSVLAEDIDQGMRVLATEIAVSRSEDEGRADRLVESTVALLLGMAEEIRYHVIERVREINPQMFDASKKFESAREGYERIMASYPPTPKAMDREVGPVIAEIKSRVVHIDSEEGKALLNLLNRISGGKIVEKGGGG